MVFENGYSSTCKQLLSLDYVVFWLFAPLNSSREARAKKESDSDAVSYLVSTHDHGVSVRRVPCPLYFLETSRVRDRPSALGWQVDPFRLSETTDRTSSHLPQSCLAYSSGQWMCPNEADSLGRSYGLSGLTGCAQERLSRAPSNGWYRNHTNART